MRKVSRIFRGRGGKWEVRTVAVRETAPNPSSPTVVFFFFLNTEWTFFPLPESNGIFLKGKKIISASKELKLLLGGGGV